MRRRLAIDGDVDRGEQPEATADEELTGEGPQDGHAAPRRRPDFLAAIVGVTAAVVYALHGFNGALSRDLAIYGYAAQRVVEGVPPYVGILNRAGPLAHLVPAVGVAIGRVVGIDDLFAMRLLFFAMSAACVSVVYLLGRNVFRSRVTGLAAAGAFLTFYGFIEHATNGPREKTTMVLLLLLMMLALAGRRWAVAAAMGSLATLVWQPVALVVAVALLLPLVGLRGAQRWRALVGMLVGGAAPFVVTLAYFAAVGAVPDFLNGFLLLNLHYTPASPFRGGFVYVWTTLEAGFGASTYVIFIGLAALLAAAAMRVRDAGIVRSTLDPIVITAAMSVAAMAWTLYDLDRWPDAHILLPFAALGAAFIFYEVMKRLPTPTTRGIAVAAWVALALVVAVRYSVTNRDHTLERQREAVAHVFEQLPPDATVLSVQAPHALVLSGKTNPTRHQMMSGGLQHYIDDTWPGGLEGFVDWVDRLEPTVVVWSGFFTNDVRGLRTLVEQKYEKAGQVRGWIWYVHPDADVDINPQVWRK